MSSCHAWTRITKTIVRTYCPLQGSLPIDKICPTSYQGDPDLVRSWGWLAPLIILLGSPGHSVWHPFMEGQQNEGVLWDSWLPTMSKSSEVWTDCAMGNTKPQQAAVLWVCGDTVCQWNRTVGIWLMWLTQVSTHGARVTVRVRCDFQAPLVFHTNWFDCHPVLGYRCRPGFRLTTAVASLWPPVPHTKLLRAFRLLLTLLIRACVVFMRGKMTWYWKALTSWKTNRHASLLRRSQLVRQSCTLWICTLLKQCNTSVF